MYLKEVINETFKVDWAIKCEKPKTDYTSCLTAKIMDASNAINEYSIRKKANYVIVNRKIAHLINVFRKLDGKKIGEMLAETRAKQKAYRIARELTEKLYTMAYKRAAGLYSFVRDMDKYEAEEKCHELFILERISENESECTFEVK